MIIPEKLRLIFSIFIVGLIASCSTSDYTSNSPTPIPSRQITQESLFFQEIWRKSTIRLPRRSDGKSPRLVTTDKVLVLPNYDHNALQYQLQALDVKTGHLVWELALSQGVGVHSVVVRDESLYVAVDWEIQKYELLNGQLIWQTPGEPTQRTGYELAWSDGNVVNYSTVLQENYSLISIYDANDGTLIQRKQIPNIPIPLLTTNQTEYRGDCGRLFVVDKPSEKVRWQVTLNGCPQRWPVLIGSNLLISTYNAYGSIAGLYMIDTSNRITKWVSLEDELISNFAVINETVYVIRRTGEIIGISLETGQEIDTIKFNTDQTDSNRNAYWLASNNQQLFAYFGDSQELIAFGLDNH